MSSVVYYRFRSAKNSHRLAFDGTGISVFDIKRGILLAQQLDATADSFQLILSNPDTKEVYSDDSEILPRSTLVEVRRLPVARMGGLDSAMQYVSGSLNFNAKNASRREVFNRQAGQDGADPADEEAQSASLAYLSGQSSANEQDMMNAMFAQQSSMWSRTQQEMATKTKVYNPVNFSGSHPNGEADKTLPAKYTCHRCGQRGHWITNCPNTNERGKEPRRVLRTKGIPKSMLRTLSELPPDAVDGDDEGRKYMINANGEYVVLVADDKSWADFQARQLQNQAKLMRSIPDELKDPISHELMRKPTKTPCCGTVYDEDSIEQALIYSDFKCPNCEKTEVYIDKLKPDEEVKQKVEEFLAESDEQEEQNDDDKEGNSESPKSHERDDDDNDTVSDSKRRKVDLDVPSLMPYMFPFMMPMMDNGKQKRDTNDYDSGDEEPVKGRVR